MNYAENPYQSPLGCLAAQADADERTTFITKTYLHLAGAIALFVILEAVLLGLPGVKELALSLMFRSQLGWLVVLGLFMLVSYVAQSWAMSAVSPAKQYAGLGLYVVAEAIIFLPLLAIADGVAESRGQGGVIAPAAVTTLGLFAVLTAVVFATRKDFSFLRAILMFGGFAAMGFIVVAAIFGFALGPIFTYAMIALACGYILYHTSNVMLHYRIGQHVAAALALFASVALLFWYILQLFMSRRD
jgi:FtsH-binding integral membrane protein